MVGEGGFVDDLEGHGDAGGGGAVAVSIDTGKYWHLSIAGLILSGEILEDLLVLKEYEFSC